ncbi:hypothetical protein ACFQX6_25795 [Streptosporangium lutulentum]
MVVVALTAVAAYLLVPESPIRTPGRISWLATLLLSGWLVALLLPLSEAPVWGWSSLGSSACWRSRSSSSPPGSSPNSARPTRSSTCA